MSATTALTDEMMVDRAYAEAQALKKPPPLDVFLDAAARRPQRPWHERFAPSTLSERRDGRPLLILMLIAAAFIATIGLRRTIVAAVPETAVVFETLGLPVNLRGMELRGIKSMVMTEGGIEQLVVQGEIINISPRAREVPPLQFSLRDGKGAEIYAWVATADLAKLEPGARGVFRRRLASPPADAADVLVRFAGRPDISH